MKNNQNNLKNIYGKGWKNLKILTEDFLDRDWSDVIKDVAANRISSRDLLEIIGAILLPYRYYGDELEEQNIPELEEGEYSPSITDEDRINLLASLHANLKPLWDELKGALYDYMKNSGVYEFEKYYDIKLPKPRIFAKDAKNKFNVIEIAANFDAGKINLIRKDVDLVNNLIEFFEGVPLDVFAKCEKCGKLIIVTRQDRNCCSVNCAAGLIQKKKWKNDHEECLEREKERYQKRKANNKH